MLRITLVFGLCTAIFAGMVWAEIRATGSYRYYFLLWNVALAWIPFLLTLLMLAIRKRTWLLCFTGAAWFFFYPNAPYMLTDIVNIDWSAFYATRHIAYDRVVFWYQFTYFSIAVILSFLLGLVSLRIVQQLIATRFGSVIGWLFTFAMMALSGYGIFLGRFVRLNSWDVVARPQKVLDTILHASTWEAFQLSGLFTLLLICTYIPANLLISWRPDWKEPHLQVKKAG